MKKMLMCILICAFMTITMTACSNNNLINLDECIITPDSKIIDFEIVDKNFYNVILVDKNTDVLYLLNTSSVGGLTPILNSDGTPKLYKNYE